MAVYKYLTKGRKSPYTLNMTWNPGEWYEVEGKLSSCNNGLHFVSERQLLWFAYSGHLWEAEIEGEREDDGIGRKIIARRGRVTRKVEGFSRRSLILYALTFVSRVPEDPWKGTEVIRAAISACWDYASLSSGRNRETLDLHHATLTDLRSVILNDLSGEELLGDGEEKNRKRRAALDTLSYVDRLIEMVALLLRYRRIGCYEWVNCPMLAAGLIRTSLMRPSQLSESTGRVEEASIGLLSYTPPPDDTPWYHSLLRSVWL